MEHQSATSNEAKTSHHVVGLGVYFAIFGALLVLTGATVWVAVLDLGEWGFLHTPLALLIAGVKAALVVVWFMHVKYSPRLTWVFIAAGVVWLALLVGITLGDYVGRRWEQPSAGWQPVSAAHDTQPARAQRSG